jgi:hypothetical protein
MHGSKLECGSQPPTIEKIKCSKVSNMLNGNQMTGMLLKLEVIDVCLVDKSFLQCGGFHWNL